MLSMHDNERYLYEALKAGASGYVRKTVADRDLVDAVRAAMRGEPFLYPGAMTDLIRGVPASGSRDEPTIREDPLTPREREVRQADRRELHDQADRRRARDLREDGRAPP